MKPILQLILFFTWPVVLVIEMFIFVYQQVYFRIHRIPMIHKHTIKQDLERTGHLKIGNWFFRDIYISANWIKAVVANTEIYSCAIKHWHKAYRQDHQANFYDPKLFDEDPKNDPPGYDLNKIINPANSLIIEEGKSFFLNTKPVSWFAGLFMYSLVIPLMIAELWFSMVYFLFFGLFGLKNKVPRQKYIILDRWGLKKLNFVHRISCAYCEYANGMVAWVNEIINVMYNPTN